MRLGWNIRRLFEGKMKIILSFFFVLLLSACGDEEHGADCPTVQDLTSPCTLCMFFDILTESATSMANASWNRLAKPLSVVVLVVAAIYIAVHTLKMVSSFGKQTVADYLTGNKGGLFILMFKTAIIYGLLVTPEFRKFVIAPLMEAALYVGSNISSVGHGVYDSVGTDWNGIFGAMKTAARNFSETVNFVVGIGEAMACDATKEGLRFWMWDYLQLLYGSILFCFGWILLAGVTFYLVDVTIRLAFAAVLLPFGIACAISNLSMPFAKNIWNLFINVFFSLIMLGIVLGIVVQVVMHCIGGGPAPFLGAYVYDIGAAIDANKISEMSSALANFGHLILTIICFSVLLQLVEQMGMLASDISDTANASEMKTAEQAIAPLGKAAMDNAKKVAGWTGETAMGAAEQIGHDVARATRLDKLYKWSGRKAEAARGFFTGTGAQGYNAFWYKQSRNKIKSELSGFASDNRTDRIRRLWRWIK